MNKKDMKVLEIKRINEKQIEATLENGEKITRGYYKGVTYLFGKPYEVDEFIMESIKATMPETTEFKSTKIAKHEKYNMIATYNSSILQAPVVAKTSH